MYGYLVNSLLAPYPIPITAFYFGDCLLVPALVQIPVDVIPRVHLVPKQLFFIQVIRIPFIITKIAVTLAVLLQVCACIINTNNISTSNVNRIKKKKIVLCEIRKILLYICILVRNICKNCNVCLYTGCRESHHSLYADKAD